MLDNLNITDCWGWVYINVHRICIIRCCECRVTFESFVSSKQQAIIQSVTLSSTPSSSGTYFTHEAKGADDAADADTAIINAEGGHTNSDEKKEYYI